MKQEDIIKIKLVSNTELIGMYQGLNSSVHDRFTKDEIELSNYLRDELYSRGYTIVPGTCVPQIVTMEEYNEYYK